jgi:hypothetical protein
MSEHEKNPSVHRAAAEGFSSGAETYVRGRPDYPAQALDWLHDALGLAAGKTVVDLVQARASSRAFCSRRKRMSSLSTRSCRCSIDCAMTSSQPPGD